MESLSQQLRAIHACVGKGIFLDAKEMPSVDRIEIGAGGCNHPIVDGCMISPIGHILQDVNNNS